MLKKIIILALLMSSLYIFGENKDIEAIRKEFKEINSKAKPVLLDYTMIVTLIDKDSEKPAKVIAYLDNKKFKKISVEYMGETVKVNTDYYFKDGKLFFVYTVNTEYNASIYMDKKQAEKLGIEAFDPKKSKITTQRFYLKNGKLIRWLDKNKKKLDVNSKKASEKLKEILQESERIKKEVKDIF